MKALFLLVLLSVALVNLSSAQIQWYVPGVKITDLGGDLSKGNFDPFICGQYIGSSNFPDGQTGVAKLTTNFGIPQLFQQFAPGIGDLTVGATWPYPGIGCHITTWRDDQELIVTGIATTDAPDRPNVCFQGVTIVTSNMQFGAPTQMFENSFKLPGDGPHHGDVALNDYNQNGFIRMAIVTGIVEQFNDPCPGLSNPIIAKRQSNSKRQNGPQYHADVIYYAGTNPVTFNVSTIFPSNSPIQGIAYSSLVMSDFNDDGNPDVFMCGTVHNSVTGLDEPYSRIWYVSFQNNTDILWTPGPQVFSQVTHCTASVVNLQPLFAEVALQPLALFFSGTDGRGNRVCEVWTRSYANDFGVVTWTRLDNALTQVQCVSHGDVEFADLDSDGCMDMILLGDATSAGGATMEGDPTAGSTTIYRGDCAGRFNFQQRLRPLHSGGVSTYVFGKGKRAFLGPQLNIIISGIQETANGTVSGTWLYEWSDFMQTSTTAAALLATTASQAAADASTTQSASLASLAGAGLLDSTTAAVSTSTAAAQSSLTTAQVTLSQATSAAALSTSSVAVTTSTQSTLTSATSTTSTRSTLVTSATSAQATSVNSVVTSLTTAAATALATSTGGGTIVPIANDAAEHHNLVVPPVSAEPNTQDGALKVSPLLSNINRDLPAIQYQIRAKNFVELDQYGLPVDSCPVPSGEFTLVTERSTSPGGYPTTVSFFTATLCNGATVLAKYTQYSAGETITFADLPIDVTAASVKLVYTVSDWPFADPANMLEVEFELILSQPALASYIIPRDEDHLLWNLQMAEKVWISSILLRKAEVDGVATSVDIYPTSASNFLGIKIRVPNFLYGVAIDPSFDVLLEGDQSKKKKSPGAAIGGGVAGGVAVLVVVGVIVYFLVFKRKGVASFGSSGSGSGSGAGASGGTA